MSLKKFFYCNQWKTRSSLYRYTNKYSTKTNIVESELIGFQNEIFKSAYNKDNIREKIRAYIKDFIKSKRPTFNWGGVQLTNTSKELMEIVKILKSPMFL